MKSLVFNAAIGALCLVFVLSMLLPYSKRAIGVASSIFVVIVFMALAGCAPVLIQSEDKCYAYGGKPSWSKSSGNERFDCR